MNYRYAFIPNLNDGKVKIKAIERLKREKGYCLPESLKFSQICDIITDVYLLDRIPKRNELPQKFVRYYSQSGIPKELINKRMRNAEWFNSKEFLKSKEWIALRYQALTRHGNKCQCCGASRKDGAIMHVDHIKPRSTHPELALSLENLQILCDKCNFGKGYKDSTDWR